MGIASVIVHMTKLRAFAAALAFVLPMGLPSEVGAIVAPGPIASAVPVSLARADTNGLDEAPLPRLSEREARREIRALQREIRREERLLRSGRGGRGRGDVEARALAPDNNMAVIGFACSLSFLTIGVFGIVGSVLGIVFGAIGLHRHRRDPERYGKRKLALAAIIVGAVTLVLLGALIGSALLL